MGDMPSAPKYKRAFVILEMGTSATFAEDGGKTAVIRAIEEAMGVYQGSGVGPGGVTLHNMFIRIEDPAVIEEGVMRLRIEYPLLNQPVPHGDFIWTKDDNKYWERQPDDSWKDITDRVLKHDLILEGVDGPYRRERGKKRLVTDVELPAEPECCADTGMGPCPWHPDGGNHPVLPEAGETEG